MIIQFSPGCSNSQVQEKKPIEKLPITEATYRGNAQHTGIYDDREAIFPVSEKWKFFAGDDGIDSAPAVANGMAYFGSNDHNFYALDAETGHERWRFETGNIIISSPAVKDETVYFGSMDGTFYALDANTGGKKWSFETSPSPKEPSNVIPKQGISSAPVIADGVVYFGSYGQRLYALDVATGKKLWEFMATDAITTSPAVSAGVVYVSCLLKLYAIDAKTGKEIWENQIQNGLDVTPVLYSDLLLYDDDVQLTAYDAKSGKYIWSVDIGLGGGLDAGPAVKDGIAFMGDKNGLYAINTKNAHIEWMNDSLGPGTGIPPSIAGGSVYLVDADAYIDVLDIQSGDVKARYKLQDKFEPFWKTTTTMAIANGVIYLGSKNGNLYAIEDDS